MRLTRKDIQLNNYIWLYTLPHSKEYSKDNNNDYVRTFAREYASNFGLAGKFDEISHTDKGKPYFPEAPDVHYSISHSGSYWIVAFSRYNIGVDLQEIRAGNTEAIAERFFQSDEVAYLKKAANADAFFKVWTAKESYVKFTGRGISGEFGGFSVIRDDDFANGIDDGKFRFVPFKPGYELCLCSQNIADVIYKERNDKYK